MLQYRTANDDRVRDSHRLLHNTTLPMDDPFWNSYIPPLGWRCRCNVVRVPADEYEQSNSELAQSIGEAATDLPKQRIFRFNPGKTLKVFPPKHPYMPKGCGNCDKNLRLAYNPQSEICRACRAIAECKDRNNYTVDEKYGDRLKISTKADTSELTDNIRAAHSILSSLPESEIYIRQHVFIKNVSNPEYVINGLVSDRKGIVSENGVSSAFNKALKQGCESVVIDLDMNLHKLRIYNLTNAIYGRHADFEENRIKECYVVYNDTSTVIKSSDFKGNKKDVKSNIANILQKIKE